MIKVCGGTSRSHKRVKSPNYNSLKNKCLQFGLDKFYNKKSFNLIMKNLWFDLNPFENNIIHESI